MRDYEGECAGCRCPGVYVPIGLCGRCRWKLRHAALTLAAILHNLATDDVLELLYRLAQRASSLCDGTAARFVRQTEPTAECPFAGDGWALEAA